MLRQNAMSQYISSDGRLGKTHLDGNVDHLARRRPVVGGPHPSAV